MREITLVRECRYTHPNGDVEVLRPGTYEVNEAVADHWFVRAHTDRPPPVALQPGTPQFAEAELAKRARERLHAAVLAQAGEAGRLQALEAATSRHPDELAVEATPPAPSEEPVADDPEPVVASEPSGKKGRT